MKAKQSPVKTHDLIFCLDAYVKPASKNLPEDHVTLEREESGFPFLPPLGMAYFPSSTIGLTNITLIVKEYGILVDEGSRFTWDIIIEDKNTKKGQVPEIPGELVELMLKQGWKLGD